MKKKPLILVVDDEPKNVRLVSAILEKFDAEVSVAMDAFRAEKILESIRPDLILLDVMMPRKTGFELCVELKQRKELKDIPIIFLTAKSSIVDTKKGFDIGAVDYITKPFRQEELLARLKTHIQLHQAREELALKLDEKNEILGMVAHDLNNPIFAIKAFSELLYDELKETESQKEMLQQVINATGHMQSIVKRILSLDELDRGKPELETELYDLGLTLQGILGMNKPHANSKNISFSVQVSDLCLVNVDGYRMKEVLDNLISNAVKYSPKDSNIQILLQNNPENTAVQFIIIDEGPGFSKKDQEKVFQKFQKLSARPTGGEHSSGLGLYIVKKLVEDMDGNVELISPVNSDGGAKFIVTIPCALCEQ